MKRIGVLMLLTLLPGLPAAWAGTAQEEANKKLVVEFYEHWDVIQEIPEKAANNNGMF